MNAYETLSTVIMIVNVIVILLIEIINNSKK